MYLTLFQLGFLIASFNWGGGGGVNLNPPSENLGIFLTFAPPSESEKCIDAPVKIWIAMFHDHAYQLLESDWLGDLATVPDHHTYAVSTSALGSTIAPLLTLVSDKTLMSATRGGSRIFIGGGGGGGAQKIICPHAHIRARNRTRFRQGSRARLKGPESSRVILMLSRAIWALLLSILIQKIGQNNPKLIQF